MKDWLYQLLTSDSADEAGLHELQELLEAGAKEPLPLTALRHYRAARLNWLRNAQEGKRPAIEFQQIWFQVQQFLQQDERRRAAEEVDFLTDLIEILKQPEAVHIARLKAISNPQMRWRFQEIMELKETDVFRRVLIVMVAAERFRLANGRWPEKLMELMPAFLKTVPADPFDGQPLRYRRKGNRIVIYSVGPNVTDDGGDIRPGRKKVMGGGFVWQQALDIGMGINAYGMDVDDYD
jgi:hypothetical protein